MPKAALLHSPLAFDFLAHQDTKNMLHASPRLHCLHPPLEVEVLVDIPRFFGVLQDTGNLQVSHDED